MILVLPDGQRVNMDNVISYGSPSDATNTIQFVQAAVTQTYTDIGMGATQSSNINFVMLQIANRVAIRDTRQVPLLPNPAMYLTSIAPTSFDIMTGTLTIKGNGFSAATAGKLFIDDRGSGWADGDGYYMTCTVLNPTTMTAVFGGAGNGVLGPGLVMLSYIDTTGLRSNLIPGTNPSSTLITIP